MMLTNKEAIEVLEFFKGQAEKYDGSLEYIKPEEVEAFSMAIDALKQTAWIPVSERLPDDFERVLVTLGSYDGVTYDWRSDGDWYDWGKSVIAWMSLPEPYKGGDNHDD